MSYLRLRTNNMQQHNPKLQMDIRIIWRNGAWFRFDVWQYRIISMHETKNEAVQAGHFHPI